VVVKWLFWAAIIGLLVASLAVGTMWLLLAALAIGFIGAMNGVFGN